MSMYVWCSSLVQVGELFTEPPQQPAAASADLPPDSSSGSSSLLKAVLQEDEAEMSELYFGSAEGLAGASSSPEADTWRQRSTVFCQQLAVLQQVQVGTLMHAGVCCNTCARR
jgi:hypothetical protein